MTKKHYFYLLIFSLIASGVLLYNSPKLFSSDPAISTSELCDLLYMDRHQRAEMMLNKKFEERADSTSINYSSDNWESSLEFSKDKERENQVYWINFSHSKKENYKNLIKMIKGSTTLLPKDTIRNDRYSRYKLGEACYFKDLGFRQDFKVYFIVVTNNYF